MSNTNRRRIMESEKVFIAQHPLTYIKDTKFHTNADCPSFRRAHPNYKKIITRREAEKLYRYCKLCENRNNKK